MKKYLALTLAAVFMLSVAAGAKEVKQPDSYYYTRGIEAYNDENYNEALDWFNRELSEHPDNGYAWLYIAYMRYGNEDYGLALTAAESALKKLPKKDNKWRAMGYGKRSDIHLALEDTVSALNDLALAIKTEPENTTYLTDRAQIYYEQDKLDLSDSDYRKSISLNPGGIMGYMGLGRNEKKRGNIDEAIAQFNHVIKLAPDYSSGYSFRADAYIMKEKWNEAADDIIQALAIDSDDKAFYLMLTFPEEALPILKSKLKIQMAKEPSNRYWPYCLGVVAENNDEYEEAISYFLDANRLDTHPTLLRKVGQAYYELKNYDKALEYADKASDINPEDYEIVDLRAMALAKLGRISESISERDRIVAEFPGSYLAYFERADDNMRALRFKDAIEDFNTSAIILPEISDLPYFLMRRGDAYRLSGNTAKASADYTHLLEIEKDSVLSTGSYSPFGYSGLGDHAKAVESMKYILDNASPKEKMDVLYNMACIYARAGKKEDAVRSLQLAVDEGYDDLSSIQYDYDFDPLRNMPEFQALTNNLRQQLDKKKEEADEAEAVYEVVEVPFTKEGGVTKVQCTINGLPLHFVFDTGAADVTLSMVEANFMLKNDYIKPTDIIGSARYVDANGDISEGTVINLRNVNFGGLELDNVRASVVRNQKAPLLLGQSVLGRLGKIEIDNQGSKLKITHRVN